MYSAHIFKMHASRFCILHCSFMASQSPYIYHTTMA